MMNNNHFPSFNFPYTAEADLRQSFCAYGSTGPLFVYQDEEENTIRCVTQKTGNTASTRVRLTARKPTLPLKPPNKVCQRFTFEKNDLELEWNCKNHYMNNLSKDHGDIVQESLAKIVHEEVMQRNWKPCNAYQTKNTASFLGNFFDDISDIPLEMLDDLFQETFVEENFEWTGKYFGNCVAHQVNSISGDPVVILAHPSGDIMDKLSLSSVQFHPDNNGLLSTKLLPGKHTFNFPNRIRQINTINAGQSCSSIMAVRTDYTCSFLKQEYGDDDELTMSVVGNLACKTKPSSVAVNPFVPGEAIIAMETGSLCLWSVGEQTSIQVVKQCSACVVEDFDWYLCEFGPHPRQVIRCNNTNVELLDLRDSSSNSKDLMTIPSPHLFKDDRFSVVQRHPENPYHYFLGTNHSLMIMDERFLQNPVLKWHHSLDEPIKHLDVVTNAFPGCGDVLLVCGGYNSHDIHCYQYCHGENSPYSLGTAANIGGLPAQATSSPWKVSSYNEWPELIDYPNKEETLHAVVSQLNQPLLGLTCISNPAPSDNTLAVIQMSKTGDLFYQCFTPHENTLTQEIDKEQVYYYEDIDIDFACSGGCGSTKPILTEKDQHTVENWLECAKHERAETNNIALQESSDTFHFSDAELLRKKVFSKLENDSKCILCEDVGFSNMDSVGEADFQKECDCCGLDENVSEKLSSVTTKEMTFLTNTYLGSSYETAELQWFDGNRDYTHPLAATLVNNWYSEEQTPVKLSGVESEDVTKEENVCKTQDSNKKGSPEKEAPHHPEMNESFTKVQKKELNTPTPKHSSQILCKESSQMFENNRLSHGIAKTNGFPADLGDQLSSPMTPSPTQKLTRKSGVKKKQARVAGF